MAELDIEKKIETAYMEKLNYVGGYIKTENIFVRRWGDNSQAKTTPCVVVHCGRVRSHNGHKNIFEANLEIICATNTIDDADRSVLLEVYDCAFQVLKNTTAQDINVLVGQIFTVDGIVFADGDEDISEDGSLQQISLKATVFCSVF